MAEGSTTYADGLDDLVLSTNADYEEAFDIVEVEQGEDDEPFDLTNCTARMQLRVTPSDSRAYLDLNSEPGGGISLNVTEGSIAIRAPASSMALVPPGTLVRDILLFRGDDVIYAGRGSVTVLKGITR